MSQCTIDHSLADVVSKLEDQQSFLPEELFEKTRQFLTENVDQSTLNEVFHLLKKYDLASDAERMERNEKLQKIV